MYYWLTLNAILVLAKKVNNWNKLEFALGFNSGPHDILRKLQITTTIN